MNNQNFGPRGPRPPFGERPHFGAERKPKRERSLEEISKTVWLSPSTASFYSKNGLLYIRFQEKDIRVTLCRMFPFELLWELISVMNEEKEEVGMIRSLSEFPTEQKDLLKTELERRYYAPEILEIESVKERFGFSYWKVKTKEGRMQIVMQDTYRNMIRVNETRVVLMDADGNRFDIPDVSKLDRKSYRKIELYL